MSDTVYVVLSDHEGEERGTGVEGLFEAVFSSRELADRYVADAGLFRTHLYIEEHDMNPARKPV